jgi:hypothetical protein
MLSIRTGNHSVIDLNKGLLTFDSSTQGCACCCLLADGQDDQGYR